MTTLRFVLATGVALFAAADVVYGQQDLTGKYSGSYETESKSPGARGGSSIIIGVELEIASLDGDKVTGTWRFLKGFCTGVYTFSGSYQGNRLQAKTVEGPKQGCGNYQLSFALDGGKWVGKFGGGQELVLAK